MERKLFSIKKKCNYNCEYCFAKWDNYFFQDNLPQKANDDIAIIYPSCDGEILSNVSEMKKLLNNLKNFDKKTIVSISTKGIITNIELKLIKAIDTYLRSHNKGFIKIGISITNKSLYNLEEGTALFSEKIENLKILSENRILTAVILKPILPFVDNLEYEDIIKTTSKYTKHFLTGGLYINKNTKFYSEYIKNIFCVKKRAVSWLDGNVEWYYICDDQKMLYIKEAIEKNNCFYFDNDLELSKFLLEMNSDR